MVSRWRSASARDEEAETGHPIVDHTSDSAGSQAASIEQNGTSAINDFFDVALVRPGLVTAAQLHEARVQQRASGTSLVTMLVEVGAIDDRAMARALADYLSLPTIDLLATPPETAAVQSLPESLASEYAVVPLSIASGGLELAVADPFAASQIAKVEQATGFSVRRVVAPIADIRRAIQSSYRSLLDVESLVDAFEAVDSKRRAASTVTVIDDDQDAPVVQVVTQIVTQGLRDRASDIHIEPQGDRVRIRFRIDGALHDVLGLPASMGPALVSRLKIMAAMNIADRRRAQDGQMALTLDGREIDVRVTTCPTVWGEKAVLRVLDRNRVLYRLEELGMRSATRDMFTALVRSPVGMVICAGPTGSGKTTTLYATLAEVNQTDRNVTTIEDPVEYVFPSLTQIQINEQAGLTFASGLRAVLRQDPDIILVGEIRDAETAKIAVESALTGHLVLSSLHATDACAALQRLVDMGVEPYLVASTVTGMVSQRLFRRVCDHCRVASSPRVEDLAFYDQHAVPDSPPLETVWNGTGCSFCANTGYRDRVGVFELVRMSDRIKQLMVAHATVDELRVAAQLEGSRSLVQEALALVNAGVTTVPEIMRNVNGR